MRVWHAGKKLIMMTMVVVTPMEWILPSIAAAAQPPAPPRVGTAVTDKETIRISPGDVVSLIVFPASEYSREVTVQPDGKIELALIGSVLAKGLTSKELQVLLEEKYSEYVANPHITVNVRKFAGRRVAILGEVKNPGYYEYRDGMHVLELLALAGGLTDNAKPGHTRILRPLGTSGGASVAVNLKAVLNGKLDRDLLMEPGDTVYVPKGRFTQGAQWTNSNLLPWVTVMTAAATIAVLVHQNTSSNP